MKKLLSIIGAVVVLVILVGVVSFAAGVFGPTPKGNGWTVGTSDGYLGFFGATPVVQQPISAAGTTTASAAVALTKLTRDIEWIDSLGATNTATVVTNVTVNTIYGTTTQAQLDGLTTRVNTQRTALVNLGLAK